MRTQPQNTLEDFAHIAELPQPLQRIPRQDGILNHPVITFETKPRLTMGPLSCGGDDSTGGCLFMEYPLVSSRNHIPVEEYHIRVAENSFEDSKDDIEDTTVPPPPPLPSKSKGFWGKALVACSCFNVPDEPATINTKTWPKKKKSKKEKSTEKLDETQDSSLNVTQDTSVGESQHSSLNDEQDSPLNETSSIDGTQDLPLENSLLNETQDTMEEKQEELQMVYSAPKSLHYRFEEVGAEKETKTPYVPKTKKKKGLARLVKRVKRSFSTREKEYGTKVKTVAISW